MLMFLGLGVLGFFGWVVFCYKPDPRLFKNLPPTKSRGNYLMDPANDPRTSGVNAARRQRLTWELMRLRSKGERSNLTVKEKQEIARRILQTQEEIKDLFY